MLMEMLNKPYFGFVQMVQKADDKNQSVLLLISKMNWQTGLHIAEKAFFFFGRKNWYAKSTLSPSIFRPHQKCFVGNAQSTSCFSC